MLHTLKDTDSGRIVVDTAGGFESRDDDGGGGDKIVRERVVQVALEQEVIRLATGSCNKLSCFMCTGTLRIPEDRRHPERHRIPFHIWIDTTPHQQMVSCCLWAAGTDCTVSAVPNEGRPTSQ